MYTWLDSVYLKNVSCTKVRDGEMEQRCPYTALNNLNQQIKRTLKVHKADKI